MTTPVDSFPSVNSHELPSVVVPGKEEPEVNSNALIGPGIRHIIATKLNHLTGGKIKCLRNWEESSGQALFETIKKVYGQKLVDATVDKIQDFQHVLSSTQASLGKNGPMARYLTDRFGIDQSVKTCRKFTEVTCLLLNQMDAGTTQNVDRLLTIVGATYSGNENVKDIVDRTLEAYSKKFFEVTLPEIIKDNCGIFAGLAEKLVVTLGVKDTVDSFLKERVLQSQSITKVLKEGDVYQKLILKGTSIFVNIEDQRVQDIKVDDLLRDKKLEPRVRAQLKRLQKYYDDSKLTQMGASTGSVLISRTLERIKGKDIAEIPQEDLAKILVDAMAFEGAYDTAKRVGTVASAVTEIGGMLKDGFVGGYNYVRRVILGERTTQISEEKKLEDDFGEYLQELFNEKAEGSEETSSSSATQPQVVAAKSVEQKMEEGTDIGGVILDKTTDALAMGLKGVGKTIETVAPAIEFTGKSVWWLGEKVVGLGKWMIGSSPKNEPENKEENKTEAAIAEQQDLPKGEPVAVQPNVVEDAKQAMPTTESKRVEEAAPVAESGEISKRQEDTISSELKEVSAEKTPENATETENKENEFSWWNPFSWWK